jgi:hypothetical protein
MSTKASISSGKNFHFYFQELLSERPQSVFLELNDPSEFQAEKETLDGRVRDRLTVEMPSEVMDQIAIAWIKKRKL